MSLDKFFDIANRVGMACVGVATANMAWRWSEFITDQTNDEKLEALNRGFRYFGVSAGATVCILALESSLYGRR
jgi:hypothetical protein